MSDSFLSTYLAARDVGIRMIAARATISAMTHTRCLYLSRVHGLHDHESDRMYHRRQIRSWMCNGGNRRNHALFRVDIRRNDTQLLQERIRGAAAGYNAVIFSYLSDRASAITADAAGTLYFKPTDDDRVRTKTSWEAMQWLTGDGDDPAHAAFPPFSPQHWDALREWAVREWCQGDEFVNDASRKWDNPRKYQRFVQHLVAPRRQQSLSQLNSYLSRQLPQLALIVRYAVPMSVSAAEWVKQREQNIGGVVRRFSASRCESYPLPGALTYAFATHLRWAGIGECISYRSTPSQPQPTMQEFFAYTYGEPLITRNDSPVLEHVDISVPGGAETLRRLSQIQAQADFS